MSASTSPLGSGNSINPGEQNPFKISQVIRHILEGRLNCVGTFTLASNAASTAITSQFAVGPNSVLLWQPISSNAAPQMTLMYVISQGNGSFTIGHGSNNNADQRFAYIAIG